MSLYVAHIAFKFPQQNTGRKLSTIKDLVLSSTPGNECLVYLNKQKNYKCIIMPVLARGQQFGSLSKML